MVLLSNLRWCLRLLRWWSCGRRESQIVILTCLGRCWCINWDSLDCFRLELDKLLQTYIVQTVLGQVLCRCKVFHCWGLLLSKVRWENSLACIAHYMMATLGILLHQLLLGRLPNTIFRAWTTSKFIWLCCDVSCLRVESSTIWDSFFDFARHWLFSSCCRCCLY